MDFSKVKLVVSDMDGTLLNTNSEVSDRFFIQFKKLKQRNIHFVAASGRQYQSILEKLDTIKHEISIIAENGGIMQHDNETNILLKLSTEDVLKTIKALRSIEDCYIVLCGRKSAYIETEDTYFISKFSKYYAEYKIVKDLTEVTNDDFLKIAVYHFESSLNMLQEKMGIHKNETMVFGDYNNDLEMLKLAHFSFAMENAHPDVKKVANFETKNNSEEGVETILEQLLES